MVTTGENRYSVRSRIGGRLLDRPNQIGAHSYMRHLQRAGENPGKPLVSVILTTFNSERFLPQALDSIFAQDYRPIEVLAVDDGSTDRSLELLRVRAGVTCIRQAHRGVSSARNTGLLSARGDILTFLDSDDIWPANRLTIAVASFEAHPEIGYVLGRQMFFVEPGYEVPFWVKPEWLIAPQDAANTGVLVARRETYARVGVFNAEFASGEDTEWLVRAKQAEVGMARLPEVLVHRRLHGENLSIGTLASRRANLTRIARESIHRRRSRDGS